VPRREGKRRRRKKIIWEKGKEKDASPAARLPFRTWRFPHSYEGKKKGKGRNLQREGKGGGGSLTNFYFTSCGSSREKEQRGGISVWEKRKRKKEGFGPGSGPLSPFRNHGKGKERKSPGGKRKNTNSPLPPLLLGFGISFSEDRKEKKSLRKGKKGSSRTAGFRSFPAYPSGRKGKGRKENPPHSLLTPVSCLYHVRQKAQKGREKKFQNKGEEKFPLLCFFTFFPPSFSHYLFEREKKGL